MDKGVQIGRNLSGHGVYKPRVDETPVPCDHYDSTDCVYVSDDTDKGYLSLDPKPSLTSFLNAVVCRMKEQDRAIEYYKNELEKLKTIVNKTL